MTNIDQLNATIAIFRREGMSKSMMIDHLVAAYCLMVVREAPLTEVEKAALVRRFTGQVTRLVYSLVSGLDITITVPLTPDVVDAVDSVAKKQGLFESGLDRDDNRLCPRATEHRAAPLELAAERTSFVPLKSVRWQALTQT